jgi:hypothetical protein
MISISFEPNKEDILKPMWQYYMNSWWISIPLVGSCLFIILFIVLLVFFPGVIQTKDNFEIFFCPIFPLVILGVFLFAPLSAARKLQQDEKLFSRAEYEFSEEQIIIRNAFTETKNTWSMYAKVLETKTHFLLFFSINKNMFNYIPKRAFSSEAELTDFRNFLRQRSLPYSNATITKPIVIAVTIIGLAFLCFILTLLFGLLEEIN